MFFQLFNLVYYIINIGKSNWFLKFGGVDLGVKFVMFYFLGGHREKKFVTFEKINSFKRGGVRYCVWGGCYDNDFGCGFEG